MNNETTNISLHAEPFYDFCSKMTPKELEKAEKKTLAKSVGIIRTQTSRNIRARWPKAYSTRHGKAIARGLVSNVRKSTKGQWYGQVHVFGNNATGERGYILKFFENGTDERSYITKNRKEHRTGRIRPLGFFNDAATAKKDEVFNDMQDRMFQVVAKEFGKSAAKTIR